MASLAEVEPLYEVVVGQPQLRRDESKEPGFGVLRHYVFELAVRPPAGAAPWTLCAGYEEMAALHGGLWERHGSEVLPPFPRKRHVSQFMYQEEAQYLEEIRSGLQAYFSALISTPALRADPDARHFLGLHGRGAGSAGPCRRGEAAGRGDAAGAAGEEAPRAARGEAPFRVAVLESDSKEAYFLRVQSTEVPSLRWSLIKNVAAMAALHDDLVAHHSRLSPPAFPRTRTVTKYLVYGSSGAYREALRDELEIYFNAVLSVAAFREDPLVRRFLEVEEHTQRVSFQVKSVCARCVGAVKRMLGLGWRESPRELSVSLQPR